jgi:alpha-L-fucosidase 2
VQSHLGYIHFLPALPKKWANGRAAGLRARGGFVLDFAWKQHRLTEARITSKCGLPLRLYSAEKLRIFGPSDSELAVQKAGEIVELPTEKGAVYQVIVD